MSHTHKRLRLQYLCHQCGKDFKTNKAGQKYCGPACYNQRRNEQWEDGHPGQKACSKCKEVKPLTEFNKSKKTTSGLLSWCKECYRNRERAELIRYVCEICGGDRVLHATAPGKETRNRKVCGDCSRRQKFEAHGGHPANYTGTKNFAGRTIAAWRHSAARRGHAWSLSKDELETLYAKQEGKCALTGVQMTEGAKGPLRPSIDRIDSREGYSVDNVQFVCSIVNIMKNKLSEPLFVALCGMIWRHSKSSVDVAVATEKFGLSPQLVRILENTIEIIGE
jgi:hypothetical protein